MMWKSAALKVEVNCALVVKVKAKVGTHRKTTMIMTKTRKCAHIAAIKSKINNHIEKTQAEWEMDRD